MVLYGDGGEGTTYQQREGGRGVLRASSFLARTSPPSKPSCSTSRLHASQRKRGTTKRRKANHNCSSDLPYGNKYLKQKIRRVRYIVLPRFLYWNTYQFNALTGTRLLYIFSHASLGRGVTKASKKPRYIITVRHGCGFLLSLLPSHTSPALHPHGLRFFFHGGGVTLTSGVWAPFNRLTRLTQFRGHWRRTASPRPPFSPETTSRAPYPWPCS